MKWSLTELRKNHRSEPLLFDETLDLKADLMARYGDEVLDLSPVHVTAQCPSLTVATSS